MEKHKRNVLILAVCQALFTSIASMMIASRGLVGQALASNKALATLPISSVVVGTALSTIPASLLMKRIGRKPGFIIGCLFAIGGALLSFYALGHGSFWLFSTGTLLVGVFSAFAQLYRFAAADTAPVHYRGKAISLVLAGGVAAGFMGPQIAKWTRNLLPVPFLGSYIAVVVLAVLSIVLLSFIDIPKPTEAETRGPERPLAKIVLQPVFIVAALSAMVGYAVMSLIMTGTPLAMVALQYPFDNAATVIQWHVVAMYLPSFFTGSLINRLGPLPVILTGVALYVATVGVALSGVSLLHFWVALVLLGVGWNFMFIGGSTLLTQSYTTAELSKTQAFNDFLVFGSVALASLSSGQLLHYLGWRMVLTAAVPWTALAAMAVIWLAWKQRPQRLEYGA